MRCAPRSRTPSSLRAASAAPATSGRPWPSPLSIALDRTRSAPASRLPAPAACAQRCPQQARSVCDRAAHPAPLRLRSVGDAPIPVRAERPRSSHRLRARSRGSRRPSDITRCYAHTSCVSGAVRGVLPRKTPRPRSPSLCQMAACTSLCIQGAALPARIACASCTRAARLRAVPGLRPRVGASGCARLRGAAPAAPSPRARTGG